MSALASEFPAPAPGRRYGLRFARPAWERETQTTWERVPATLPDARPRVWPVPEGLVPYVRDARHYRCVITAVSGRASKEDYSPLAPPFTGARLECAQQVLALPQDGTQDALLSELLLLLFPPVPCGSCGRPYLRENGRRAYCSDRCRRKAQYAMARARAKEPV